MSLIRRGTLHGKMARLLQQTASHCVFTLDATQRRHPRPVEYTAELPGANTQAESSADNPKLRRKI